ncbi:CHRD domain-containing protein [Bacillus thuringiensis]|uniref:CHRD domain-containing protein n=1 Tax=Bacillus thuringiensis TaxID=1428 RepID=UPI000BFD787D|nr:CHRD domain-containing protein [Bacillus thuringiensis]PGW34300.1 CHRD domain-containing protein [Bacillus thuringiensis]
MFFSKLCGVEEVPAVETTARGKAYFVLSQDNSSLEFKLSLYELNQITMGHLHLGKKGTNGPVVVFLFGPIEKPISIEYAIFTGEITQVDLVGLLAGHSLRDLVNEINAENIYVNVHTVQHPSGEIRGQLSSCCC